ncbi:unnamed protein product, partial [Laminaria digitata]
NRVERQQHPILYGYYWQCSARVCTPCFAPVCRYVDVSGPKKVSYYSDLRCCIRPRRRHTYYTYVREGGGETDNSGGTLFLCFCCCVSFSFILLLLGSWFLDIPP